jgi:uncharacterized protein YjbI with pentapeptide repeats
MLKENFTNIDIINRKINKDPYLTACEALEIAPTSYIMENLGSSELKLAHHGIGPLGSRALGKVLETNKTVQILNLSYNDVSWGGSYFAASMCHNSVLVNVDLSYNNLSSLGLY